MPNIVLINRLIWLGKIDFETFGICIKAVLQIFRRQSAEPYILLVIFPFFTFTEILGFSYN